MSLKSLTVLSIAVGALSIFSGCASPTQSTAMVATPQLGQVHKSPSTASVSVIGGRETSSMGASQISNHDFGEAIKSSLIQAGLFAKVGEPDTARYQLNAFIAKVSQPLIGFAMTVDMEVSYNLVDSRTKKSVWEKTIASQHTAAVSDAFAGVVRLRLATEGAAKHNINSLITALAKLDLN